MWHVTGDVVSLDSYYTLINDRATIYPNFQEDVTVQGGTFYSHGTCRETKDPSFHCQNGLFRFYDQKVKCTKIIIK